MRNLDCESGLTRCMSRLALEAFLMMMMMLLVTYAQDENQHCTAIGFGRKATATGATMIAHTDDSGLGTADLRLVRVPAANHKPGSLRPIHFPNCEYPRIVDGTRAPAYAPTGNTPAMKPLGYIPQVDHTFAYWDMNYALVNEHGLGFAESTCGAKTVGWSPRHGGPNLMSIEELTKIALERCKTAKCAVKLMGDLSVRYGYFSTEALPGTNSFSAAAECVLVSDALEVWHFHVMTAPSGASAVWAAQKVPDDHVTSLPNSFVIRTMDLEDPDNYLASDGIEQVAIDGGFYDPSTGLPFDFLASFGYFNGSTMHLGPNCPEDYNLYAGRRTWRIFDKVAPSLHLDPALGQRASYVTYPFSVQPDALITLKDVKDLLRDHYEGTPFDLTRGLGAGPFGSPTRWSGGINEAALGGGWERAISMFRTSWAFIIESREVSKTVPDPAKTRVWFGFDTPTATVFTPLYATQEVPPPSWTWPLQCTFSRSSTFWAVDFIKNWVDLRYNVMMPDVRSVQQKLEQQLLTAADKLEAEAAAALTGGGAAADLRSGTSNGLQPSTLVSDSWGVRAQSVAAARTAVRARLESFAVSAAENVTLKLWSLADALVARYSNGYKCLGDIEGTLLEGDRLAPGYPKEWLQAVGFQDYPTTRPPPHMHNEGEETLRGQDNELLVVPNMAASSQQAGSEEIGSETSSKKAVLKKDTASSRKGAPSSVLSRGELQKGASDRRTKVKSISHVVAAYVASALRNTADWLAPSSSGRLAGTQLQ
ncbi:hypothetical protein CEUSTIGMA_g8633.t1 [Chlamydomonas eustigma]|uniref:Uncharacterized protein n=1 Tax=Chlamydomonas eustigma TaxID=1157962 RepID=A0A250XDT0_9CHLO|nr:hypothetical protein CEUSTIGMA_g8633.t1 [Chlamydomonas eustigma]|eukprot:GAX81201.1 hypothetical protein CEUSTIGMA_g8633.t1 [Chlamydomonas eustigma]